MNTIDDLAALHRRAERQETGCGDGVLVWHRWGPSGGPPVLLLHGGSGSWTHWARNIDALAQAGHAVWVPDLPGFGDSAAPPDGHDADVLPAWLELGLQSLVGDTPVQLVGFSFGALVAGLWADAFPDRVARLVLVGSPCLSAELLPPLDLRRWDAMPAGSARDAVHRHNLLQLMLDDESSATALAVALLSLGDDDVLLIIATTPTASIPTAAPPTTVAIQPFFMRTPRLVCTASLRHTFDVSHSQFGSRTANLLRCRGSA